MSRTNADPALPAAARLPPHGPSSLPGVTLVLGGARSGKSRHAESLLADAQDRLYIATSEAGDAEMAERIRQHREGRGDRWRTVEAAVALEAALTAEPDVPALVDCLTLWLSNLLLGGYDVEEATLALARALALRTASTILVSNEVGLGIVPDNALARAFRDAAGRLNQRMAELAGTVVFVAAGLPLLLKQPAPSDAAGAHP